MPRIGNVEVSDDVIASLGRGPAPPRPGLGSVLSAATQNAYGQVRYGVPMAVEKLAGTLSPEDDQFYKAGLARADAAGAAAPAASVDDLTSGRVGIARWLGENFAASAPQSLSILAGGIAGGLVGGPPGALAGVAAVGAPQFIGSNVDRAVQEQGGLSSAAAERSVFASVPQAIGEGLADRFLPGVGHIFGGTAAHAAGGFFARAGKAALKLGGAEAVEEAGQQMGERYAAGIPVTGAAAAAEYTNAAVTAFAMGGVMGAVGGGFRRSAAVAKPTAQVTNEDTIDHVNRILGLPAPNTGPGSGQLALPAPPDVVADARGVSAAGPGARDQLGGDQEAFRQYMATRQSTPLATDPNAPVAPIPPAWVSPNSVDYPASRFDIANANSPDASIPDALRASVPGAVPGLRSTASPTAIAAAQVGAETTPNALEGAPPRPFVAEPIADLKTATQAKSASPELRQHAEDEIRNRYAEATGAASLTADNFQQRVEDLKHGLNGQFVKKLAATDPTDLVNKIYDEVFVNQNDAANVVKLAQRADLLDDKLQPTERANQLEAERTGKIQAEAAPSDKAFKDMNPTEQAAYRQQSDEDNYQRLLESEPDLTREEYARRKVDGMKFVRQQLTGSTEGAAPVTEAVAPAAPPAAPSFTPQEWSQLKADAGISRLRSGTDLGTSPDLDAARVTLFRALANDKITRAGEPSQTERLAQQAGLITNDAAMDVTPLGHRTYLATPEGAAEVATAAEAQGYAGAQALVFDKGVQAQLTGQTQATFTSFEDLAAHEAGKVWAKHYVDTAGVNSTAQTDAVMSRIGGMRELSPAQKQQQEALNNLLGAADLKSASQDDVAALFRMVRDGATPVEVGQALQKVQGGKTLFEQPATVPTQLSPKPTRGQPQFREINTPEAGPGKATQRAATAAAINQKRVALRQEIDAAFQSGDITPKERIGLVARLMGNDFAGVANHLPGGPLRNEMNVSRRGFLAGVAAAAVTAGVDGVQAKVAPLARTATAGQLRAYVTSGNILAALKHLGEHSTNTSYRLIARKLVAAGGWDRVTMMTGEDQGSLYGTTQLNDDGSSTVELYGEHGLEEETVLHELIHAFVQQRWAGVSVYSEHNERLINALSDRHDAAIHAFTALWSKIGEAIKATNPGLIESEAWAQNFYGDPDEALSWLMTNQQAQTYLKSIDETGAKVATGPTAWDKFVSWIAGLFGLPHTPSAAHTALDSLLSAGYALLDAGKDVSTNDFGTKFAAGLAKQAGRMEMRVSAENRTVGAANDAMKGLSALTEQLTSRINLADWGVKARRLGFGLLSQKQLDRAYPDQTGMLKRTAAMEQKTAIRGRIVNVGEGAYQNFEKLMQAKPQHAEWVGQLMAGATENQLDPFKPFDDHSHLGISRDADGKRVIAKGREAEIARLEPIHRELVKMKNDLSRGDGAGIKVFNDLRTLNEAQNMMHLSVDLHDMIANDPELALGVAGAAVNPADKFMLQADLTAPADIRTYTAGELSDQLKAAAAFVEVKRGGMATEKHAAQLATAQHLAPIEAKIADIHSALASMARAPYFHLGRFGDNFGSAIIRTNEDGTVDLKAQRRVAEALIAKGFENVQISTDNTKPKFYARFDTVDQVNAFKALMLELHRQGHLSADVGDIKAGPRTQADNYGVAGALPGYINDYVANLRTSPAFTPTDDMTPAEKAGLYAQQEEAIQIARDTWLERQPDNSISKVLTQRNTVPGYHPDMLRNWAQRWVVGANSIANVATAPKINAAYVEMRTAALEATSAGNAKDPFLAADLLREVKLRDATAPINPVAGTLDKVRAYTHAYFLGLSPAFGVVNLTQLGTYGLPELAKKNGYVSSFHAMRRATSPAVAVLKAATAEGIAKGWKHATDAVITDSVLKSAGLSAGQIEFLRHMQATGQLDIGTAAHALGQIARGGASSTTETALRYASSIGLYTETFNRLTMALAAHELHGGSTADAAAYAGKTISNSMFDYQSWNTGRLLGKKGFLGPVTPLVTQFMSYSVQATEKLYSEAVDAVGRTRPGETAETAAARRKEARTFMLGHLTAVTALAGTLGLPFASVFATVIERMFGSGDEPYDATAAWRNFLASVFGKDAAEVIARGLPHAAGFDISKRAGEADLLPFSKLIGDKRSWRDAVGSSLGGAVGAGPSALVNILDGGEQLANGDIMAGMKAIVPTFLKGPVEAYRMSTEGYVDTRGTKLPMTPGATAILWQLIGFNPAEKAEYSEARGDQQSRRVALTQRADTLRSGIVKAMVEGNHARASELIGHAQKFDQANQDFAVIPSLDGALQRQKSAQLQARAIQAPLGVSMQDIAGQRLTRYANVDYGANAR